MNKNSAAAMIIKTIATDRQLDTRESSPTTRTTQTTVIEKSYLRSQFERRQRRQIELTNRMHYQQQPAERGHPDLVASSHELAKRRFFDQLERRESINSARATQQRTSKAAQLHQQQQQQPTRAKPNENRPAECTIKVDVNEPDGAGTDADEATSLETIITNNSSRLNETLAAAPQNSSCEAPPLDNSKVRDDQQVQQVELRVVGTGDENDRGERTTCRLEEAADVEQTSELLAQELRSGRQPSKEDLRDRPQPIADQEERHERLRPFSINQQQQQFEQQEQYANPRPSLLDSAQGSHENCSRGNNVNHDQYDGHHEILNNSQAPQVFAGMQFEDEKEGINLLGHGSVGPATVDLLQQQRPLSFKSPDSESVQDHEVRDEHENGKQMCDTVQRCPPFLVSAAMNSAQEEDVRSSCSSSGFGASVSAGSSASSSSEGQPERNRHHHHYERHLQTKDKDYGSEHEVGSSIQYEAFPLNGEFHLSQLDKGPDEIGQFEIIVGRLDGNTADLTDQTLSVGPERAHRINDERSMLHVENHGYGSLGNNEPRLMIVKTEGDLNCNKTKTMRNQTDKRRWPLVNPGEFTSELELDSSSRQYVNLPAATNDLADNQNSSSYDSMGEATAGYATVRARPTSLLVDMHSRGQAGAAGLANIPPAGNNGHSATTNHGHNPGVLAKVNRRNSDKVARSGELEDCGSHLSGHNSSTSSSASSGGFSKLPPVRLIDHNFANNFEYSSSSSSSKAPQERESYARAPSARMGESNNSMQQHQLQSKKSASLLKRFGSLVSRAFTSSNNFSGGEFNGSGTRSSAKNSGTHCDGGGQKSAQANGARLETKNQPSSSSSAMPPLKQQTSSRESTNGISLPPLQAHKSIENATGVLREDHHQDHHANQNRGQQQQQLRQTLKPLDQGAFVGAAGKSLVMAGADLVILSSKHSRNNYQAPRNKTTAAAAANDYHSPKSRRNTIELSRGLGEKVSSKVRRCSSRNEKRHHHDNYRSGQLTRETSANAFLLRRSTSSASCSTFTSLDNSSLTCSSTRDLSQRERAALSRRRTRRERLHDRTLRRASSLSDELESLISPSDLGLDSQRAPAGQAHLMPSDKCGETSTKLSQRPSTITANKTNGTSRSELTAATNYESNSQRESKSRSITRWFSVNGSVGSSPVPVATNDDRNSIQCEPNWQSRESQHDDLRSNRGRYHGPKSFISHSHADSDCKLNRLKANRKFAILSSKLQKGSSKETANGEGSLEMGEPQPMSLVYSSLNLPARSQHGDHESRRQNSHWLKRTDKDLGDKLGEDELVVNDGKCQSLNLYQNLLRNYVKRRNHHHHHRHHRHHSHHHHDHHHQHAHHHNRSSSSRHAHCSSSSAAAVAAATTKRCGQQQRCVSPVGRACSCSSVDQLSVAGHGKTHGDTASVWGQLIEINKSDGSQVIELQRAPGRSWGFFVARGAINNKKGIFISRMHNSSSGGRPLNGLLGVGDRILSIDNYLIEPDFDILRVNQMISKKSKIFLEVKPFKG